MGRKERLQKRAKRDQAFEYFYGFALPSRKYALDHPLSKYYFAGMRTASAIHGWFTRRFYALRLFIHGFVTYWTEYK